MPIQRQEKKGKGRGAYHRLGSPENADAVALRSEKCRGGVPVVSCSQRGGADARRDTADSMEISGMILASGKAGAR